ncbi:MAG: hypothetical protein RH917_02225 [Lacipirellulaceae bacterium]
MAFKTMQDVIPTGGSPTEESGLNQSSMPARIGFTPDFSGAETPVEMTKW